MEMMVNGKPMQLSDGTTAAALLEQMGIQPERVVVEVNLNVLKRAQLTSTVLHAGDHVEIVHFVGGGSVSDIFFEAAKTKMISDTERGRWRRTS